MTDTTLHDEISLEQKHVDRVYERLAQLKKDALRAEAEGYQLARVGNFGSLVERDAMVFHAARRRHTLDAEHEGLVFGRLDMRPDFVAEITLPDAAAAGGPSSAEKGPQGQGAAEEDPAARSEAKPGAAEEGQEAQDEAGRSGVAGPKVAEEGSEQATAGEQGRATASAAGAGEAEDGRKPRYVGRLGVRAEDGEPLLIDWRAPAAAAFYRATAAHPQGVIRRRMITSFGEKVTALDDDLLDPAAAGPDIRVVGDGALMAALSRAKGTGMRDIVATIQHEQDLAIRAPASGVTVVEGGPGTGKTAVALHRAAYLLYTDRTRFAGGGVLIVGPSPVFVRYIETVLPALGEESATLRSLGQLVVGFDATREETAAVRAIKGSLRMRRVLRRAAEDAPPGAPDGLRIRYRGEWLVLSKKEIEEIRRRVGRGQRRNEIRGRAFGEILDALYPQMRGTIEQARFDEELSDHEGFRAFLRQWWPLVTPLEVLGWLGEPRRLRRYADGALSNDEQRRLARSISREPSIDDIPLLDELTELVGTQPKPKRRQSKTPQVLGTVQQSSRVERPADYRDFAHVVVDESQDVTPMQWRMIGRRGHAASWTIVGDPAQSAWIGNPQEPARARDEAIGGRARHHHQLTTNYRNSAEIFEVAAEVIRRVSPDLPLPKAVRSTGVAPVDLVVSADRLRDTIRAAVERMRTEVEGTVGIIAPDARMRDLVAGWVKLDERTSAVTALAAKGMEYDGVVLVEPAYVDSPRTLYVALSRATQRLTTVSTRPWRDQSGGRSPGTISPDS